MRKSSLIKAIACFTAATTAITGISSINMMNGMSIVVEAAEDESETLTGTAWWTGSQKGKDYTLTGDGKVVLYVEAEKLVDGYGAFNVELQSTKSSDAGRGYFMTTGSDKNAWLAEDAAGVGTIEGIEPEGPTRASTLTEGHIYKITITRTGQDFIVEYYDDTTKEEYCVFTLKGSNFPTEDVNVHVIAQIGTYKVIQEIQNTPEEPTESETLTGTAWWTGSQKGKDYTLTGDGKVVLYVEAEKLIDDYGAFSVELQSTKSSDAGHGYFMTTGSDKNAWTAEDAAGVGTIEGIEPEGPTRASTLTEGHIYKITITRTGQDFIVEYYDDTTKEEYCVFTLKGSNFPTEDVNVHVIAQIGTYKVIQEIQNTPEEPTEPEKPTESETLTGTAWWTGSQKGKDYTLTEDSKVVLYVEAEKLVDGYGAFNVELQSTKSNGTSHGYFMTTGSDRNAWLAEDAMEVGTIEGIEPEGPTRASTLTEGHIYKITITRTGQDFIVEYYDDTTKEEYCVFTLKGSNFPTEDVNVHVIAQIGTYKVTQKIEQSIEPDKPTPKPPTTGGGITPKPPTTGGGITPEPPTTGGAITNKYAVIIEATTEKKEIITDGWWKEFSDYYQLTGDFNVTFNITNKGGEKAWNNPVTVFTTAAEREDKENYKEYAVIRSDSWGWGGGDNLTSDGNAITYVNDWAEPDILVAAMKDATITKNIVRSGNEFTMKDTIVSADGKTFTSTTKFTTAADKTMNIFLTTDTASMTINSYSGNTSSGNNTPNNPSGGNTNQGGSSSGGSSSNTNTSVKPDDKKPTTDDDKKPSTDNDNNKPTTDNNKPSTDNDSNK